MKNENVKLISSLKEQIKLNREQLLANAPKVAFFDAAMERKSTYSTAMLANELEMCATKLSNRLNALCIQYKQSGMWHLYSKYQDLDLTVVVPKFIADKDGVYGSTPQTRWTEKGREFIINLRKENKL